MSDPAAPAADPAPAEPAPAAKPALEGDQKLVNESWAAVKAANPVVEVAKAFYAELFAQAPEMKEKQFANVDMSVVSEKLMATVDFATAFEGSVEEKLVELGERHAGYGVVEANYPVFGKALTATLKAKLGDKFTAEVETAWTNIYGTIQTAMLKGHATEKGQAAAAEWAKNHPVKPSPFTPEDFDLEAELAKLEEEEHTLETAIASADEEAKARDAAEEQIVAEKEHVAAIHKENRELQAEVDVLVKMVKDIGDLKRWGEKIKELEKTFQDGNLNSIWLTTLEQDKLEDLRATQTTYTPKKEFDELLRTIANNHEIESLRTEEQEVRLEQQKLLIDREKTVALTRLQEEFQLEKTKLEQMRKKLKVVLQEQAFHIKRGTHVKRPNVDIKPKDQHIAVEREKELYNQTCRRVIDERAKIGVINAEIQTLKETREHIVKDGEERKKKAQEALAAAATEAEDAEWEYQTLKQEFDDLRKLRTEIIATSTAVKKAVET